MAAFFFFFYLSSYRDANARHLEFRRSPPFPPAASRARIVHIAEENAAGQSLTFSVKPNAIVLAPLRNNTRFRLQLERPSVLWLRCCLGGIKRHDSANILSKLDF